jgi:hypothetical protein
MSALPQRPSERKQTDANRISPFFPTITAGLVSTGTLAPCFAIGLILQSTQAPAQEALRNSLAGDAAAEALRTHEESLPYTFKSGDFRLLIEPMLDLSWNDNVNLTKNSPEDDYILRPAVQFDASYPLTERNLLQVDVTGGYNYYVNHSSLSRPYLASGSRVSFDFFVKDWHFNLHDRISYAQDSASEAAVSATGNYGTFQNTAGLSGTWDYGDVVSTLGYDHQNTLATSSQFNNINNSSELLLGRVGLKVRPWATLGIEGTGTITSYEQSALNDSTGWSAGVYVELTPDAYFSVKPRFGYTVNYYRQTSQFTQASDQSSWYGDLTVSHQVTRFLTYSLSAGHELRPGIESDALEDSYVRPSLSWSVIKRVLIGTSFSYEHGSQAGGQLSTTFGQNYDYYNAGFNVSFTPLKRMSVNLYYRYTIRASDVATGEYSQDVVGVTLNYALP